MKAMDNTIDYIRRNRGRFLRAKKTEPIELVERILGDALYGGASECAVLRQNDWWIIASTTDWLCGHEAYAPEDMFHRIVAMPEAGQNAMRSEVLLTAFAPKVITATPTACLVISGEVSMDDEVWNLVSKCPEWQRMIAFNLCQRALAGG
jgi:hypothetical protein